MSMIRGELRTKSRDSAAVEPLSKFRRRRKSLAYRGSLKLGAVVYHLRSMEELSSLVELPGDAQML